MHTPRVKQSAMAMPKNVVVLAGVVGLLGLLAAVLGFVGESASSKSFDRYDGKTCVYRRTPAAGCGVVAALLLLAAQITVSAATGCCGCCGQHQPPPSRTKRVAAVCISVVSWYVRAPCSDELSIVLPDADGSPIVVARAASARCRLLVVIAVGIFFYGASWNTGGERSPAAEAKDHAAARCYELRRGAFATASVLSLVVVGLGVASYALLRGERATVTLGRPEVAMGQPGPYFTAVHPPPPAGGYHGGGGGGAAAGASSWAHQGKATI
ncbi:hypothetical protein ACP4OV_003061 [Aristida adscensionis]